MCNMTNAINCKCGFTRGSNHKRGNIIAIYNKLKHTRKRRPQDITYNIYLNDNKCNTLAEDVGIKNIWSGYYSEKLNETNRKSNYCSSISDIRRGDQKAAGYKMKLNKTCDQT